MVAWSALLSPYREGDLLALRPMLAQDGGHADQPIDCHARFSCGLAYGG